VNLARSILLVVPDLKQVRRSARMNQESESPKENHHLVSIVINEVPHNLERDKYLIAILKGKLGVPIDYELDLVVDGQFKHLADDAEIKIKGGEIFISHVRRGGSS
jgi:hypothetical protein